tara:strand:+ start:12193 stop:15735 length:3543 start_codon:yes stop_codon:yes gene_type:complete
MDPSLTRENENAPAYQRMTHEMHIKERPDTYLGCGFGLVLENVWTAYMNDDGSTTFAPSLSSVPLALIAVSKELFDNATDNVERSRTSNLDPGIIEVAMDANCLSITNYGQHISTAIHPIEGIPIPQLLFGVLLTSDNYDDNINRYKIGRNGYGSKLPNLFSIMFRLIIGDPVRQIQYDQTWQDGMSVCNAPMTQPYNGPGFTRIMFYPNFSKLYASGPETPPIFIAPMMELYRCRVAEMSFAAQIQTSFNGSLMDYTDPMVFFKSHFKPFKPDMGIVQWKSPDGKNEFIIADAPNKGWAHAFVNGTPVHQGEHVNEYLRAIFRPVCDMFESRYRKKLTITNYRKHVAILLRVTVNKPEFDGQIKRKMIKPAKLKIPMERAYTKDILNWKLIADLKKSVGIVDKIKASTLPKFKIGKVEHAIQSDSKDAHERLKCRLILTEGNTGKIIAMKATKFLPGGKDYNGVFPLRGVPINVSRHSVDRIAANKEIASILGILNADPSLDYHNDPKNCLTLRYGTIILMMDADPDGAHIAGLMMNFIMEYLETLAPFNFIMMMHTPIIQGIKGTSCLNFYYQNQLDTWLENNDKTGWDFQYKKGLGSWDTDDDVLKPLFTDPVLISMAIDENTNDMFKLAFGKEGANDRKAWITGYDEKKPIVLTNPRPYSHFLNNDYLAFSHYAVIRAIPSRMDGMKPVHRKVLYSLFLKFPSKKVNYKRPKMIQFAGFVMEKSGYHHGDAALLGAMTVMGAKYLTGPNNIPLLDGEGNYGARLERGNDASHGRYLFVKLARIAHYIYPREDFPLMEILYDEGIPTEPKEMYPIIPMALVNRCEGIGTGWSTKIYPHSPFVILEWVRQWVEEKKAKRDIPDDELTINVADKPELIPWYRGYSGSFVRIKSKPFEVFRNEGAFKMNFHTIMVTEIPVETSILKYRLWGEMKVEQYMESPETGVFRSFKYHAQPPTIDYRVEGCSTPTLEKLNLTKTVSMSNMMLLDEDRTPRKYNYTFEIVCDWCIKRLTIYVKRKDLIRRQLQVKMELASLRYKYIMEVINRTLIVANRSRKDLIPEMIERGYPYGANKTKKKKKKNDLVDADELEEEKKVNVENPEDNAMTTANPEEEFGKTDFLAMPINSLTKEKAAKLEKLVESTKILYEEFIKKLPEDLWLEDLAVLSVELNRLYNSKNKKK